MNAALFQSFSKVYLGDPKKDLLTQYTSSGEQIISEAQSYLSRMIQTRVVEEFRPALENVRSLLLEKEAVRQRDAWEIEYQQISEPEPIWMRARVRITKRDADQSPAEYLLTLEEIDSVKKEHLEEERKKRERDILVNQAFENSNILKFTLYVKERYGIASQGIEDLHGAPRRLENMPDTFRDYFVRPDYHALHDEMYARCLSGINHASCELVDVQGHWTRVTLEIVETDAEGKPTIILGIVENTDELHAARTEVEIMEEVCQFAVNSHYEDANLIDVQNNSVKCLLKRPVSNAVTFHFSNNQSYDESMEHMIEEHAASEADAQLLATLRLERLVPILQEKKLYSIRCRVRSDEGEVSWKLVECTFFKGYEDRIIMLTTDVQDEENIKEQLRDAAIEAQEANHAKSAFLANMSHEIRTPMNAIVGISEILLGKDLPEDVLMDIGTIQNSGSSLLGIINDILDFSKIETGKFEISEVEYMLPSVLMDISNVISVRLSGRPVFFMMDIDPALPNQMIGDDIRLKQILLNLIGNSVKFTHEGFIELRAEGRFLDDEDYEMTFEVRDSGIGIRKEDFGKLFKTFSQVDTRKNRAVTGSGLGLSISKNLAEMMNGSLSVESEYGKGSIFTVKVIQKVRYYEKIGEVRHKQDVRILICEQNEMILHSLRRTLEKLGLQYEICREADKLRSFTGMTHVLIRRKAFGNVREKLEFMFEQPNIFLVLENDEHPEGHYMRYKQLQLPLIAMQLINALNDEEIVTSIKKKTFDRSQIVPLTFARILLVDDNTTNLQVAQGLMAPYKMKIDVATSGFKAIELVKSIHYDAIFMDHMMPEMDGIEATQYIRSLDGEYYKNVPIIALTANAMSGAKNMFLEAGMNDFVAKPIEMTELNRVLKRFVQANAPAGYMKSIQKQAGKGVPESPFAIPTAGAGFGGQAAPFGMAPGGAAFGGQASLYGMAPGGAAFGAQTSPYGAAPGGAFFGAQASSYGMPGGAEQGGQSLSSGMQPGGQDVFGQLLWQNGGLLSQNLLLLQQIAAARFYAQPSAAEAAEEHQKDETQEESFEELRDYIPGVDMQECIDMYGGSVAIYHDILRTYYFDIRQREPILTQLYEKKDIHTFTIYVHAIKSASRGAGANELGEMAYQLEIAGKNGDWKEIDERFPAFMEALHKMVENVGVYARKYLIVEKKNAQSGLLEDFDASILEKIRRACDEMDYLTAEDLLRELDQKSYRADLEEKLQAMLEACSTFEYESWRKSSGPVSA